MGIEIKFTPEIVKVLDNFLEKRRPPVEIRNQLDIGYRFDNQSIIIYEIRPMWKNPKEIVHHDFAKTTFVKNKNLWKIFWLRANGKWDSYEPQPIVKSVKDFVKIIDEDKYACFRG